MARTIISVKDLQKIYKKYGKTPIPTKYQALYNISFDVKENEIYGFLGQNGAGKTTTIKILMQLMPYNKGQISINGKTFPDPDIQKEIGYLPELPYFYDFLTLREMLYYYGNLFNIPKHRLAERIEYLIDLVGLRGRENTRLGEYSKGMLQRSGLAQALINDPGILILDEPLSGLDPMGRKELRDIILSQKKQGKTILFSSHILQDAEMVCDRISIVKKGSVILEGSMRELMPPMDNIYEIHLMGLDKEGEDFVRAREDYVLLFLDGHGNCIIKTLEETSVTKIINDLHPLESKIVKIAKKIPTLEDIFVEKNIDE